MSETTIFESGLGGEPELVTPVRLAASFRQLKKMNVDVELHPSMQRAFLFHDFFYSSVFSSLTLQTRL